MKDGHPHDGHGAQRVEAIEALAFKGCNRWSFGHTATIAQAPGADAISRQVMERCEACVIVRRMNPSASLTFGTQLRGWRQRRRLSQLDLAADASVSTRHLSFVETGRAMPSREMVLHLANRLDVPLRERNVLLTAAGFAPMYAERGLDDPALRAAREAVEQILKAHEPYPALAVDRHWNMVSHNAAALPLFGLGMAAELLTPPVNVLRLSLHPRGLAPFIVNFTQWREHLLERVQHQVTISANPTLETFFPADAQTAAVLRRMAQAAGAA